MRRSVLALVLAFCSSCTLVETVDRLDQESPSSHLGRPGWVRAPARAGAWIGGVVGAVASVVTFPVTWTITQFAEEPLGKSKDEFLYLPVSMVAGTGHYLLGAPFDALDWTFRRAWIDEEEPMDYGFEPQAPPRSLDPDPGAGDGDAKNQ